jgi:hypothetical protein
VKSSKGPGEDTEQDLVQGGDRLHIRGRVLPRHIRLHMPIKLLKVECSNMEAYMGVMAAFSTRELAIDHDRCSSDTGTVTNTLATMPRIQAMRYSLINRPIR